MQHSADCSPSLEAWGTVTERMPGSRKNPLLHLHMYIVTLQKQSMLRQDIISCVKPSCWKRQYLSICWWLLQILLVPAIGWCNPTRKTTFKKNPVHYVSFHLRGKERQHQLGRLRTCIAACEWATAWCVLWPLPQAQPAPLQIHGLIRVRPSIFNYMEME